MWNTEQNTLISDRREDMVTNGGITRPFDWVYGRFYTRFTEFSTRVTKFMTRIDQN